MAKKDSNTTEVLSVTQLEKEAEDIILFNNFALARNFLQKISDFLVKNRNFQQSQPEIYQKYQNLIAKVSWIALNTLRENEIVNLFENHLHTAFQIKDFDPLEDILNKLKVVLLTYGLLEDRDEFKKRLREAIIENNQVLFIPVKNRKEKSVSQWIKDYMANLGTEPVSKVKLIEYLTKVSGAEKLTSNQKEKLLKLFSLFEALKFSSFDARGREEDLLIKRGNQLIIIKKDKEILLTEKLVKTPEKRRLDTQLIEEEIKELEKQKKSALPPLDLNQAITEVINKTELRFSEEPLKKRFQNIVESFLRDVRSEIETRIVLKRDQKIGGLSYEDEKVDEIINILNKQKPRIKVEPRKDISPSVGLAEGIKSPEDLLQVETRIQKPKPELEKKEPESESVKDQKLEVKPEPEPKPEPIPKPKTEPEPIPTPQPTPELKPEPIPTPQPTSESEPKTEPEKKEPVTSSILELKPDSTVGIPVKKEPIITEKLSGEPEKEINFVQAIDKKPQIKEPEPELEPQIIKEKKPELPAEAELKPKVMIPPAPDLNQAPSEHLPAQKEAEEVKVKPKIFGPIGELQSLTLIDWRRWGTPDQAINRIEDKINLLAEESLIKKSEAIKAWKESEINKLYLGIGEESINEGMSVAEVITKRQQQSRPTLTEEEFNAVIGLNEKLRF